MPERRLCSAGATCYGLEVKKFGSETRHLGWRMVDALLPMSAMAMALNVTVPPAGRPLRTDELWQHVDVAAAADGVGIFSTNNKRLVVAKAYQPILQGRHRELSVAWAAVTRAHADAGADGRALTTDAELMTTATASALQPLIERCADYRTLGMAAPLAREDADALLRQSELPEAVDYGEPRWFANDEDARRAPQGTTQAFCRRVPSMAVS